MTSKAAVRENQIIFEEAEKNDGDSKLNVSAIEKSGFSGINKKSLKQHPGMQQRKADTKNEYILNKKLLK